MAKNTGDAHAHNWLCAAFAKDKAKDKDKDMEEDKDVCGEKRKIEIESESEETEEGVTSVRKKLKKQGEIIAAMQVGCIYYLVLFY